MVQIGSIDITEPLYKSFIMKVQGVTIMIGLMTINQDNNYVSPEISVSHYAHFTEFYDWIIHQYLEELECSVLRSFVAMYNFIFDDNYSLVGKGIVSALLLIIILL